jgi:hypothetical protein
MTKMTRDQARAYHPSMTPIWNGRDDFDQTVRDAQAVVEAGKRRLRVVGDDERGLPALLFSTSRERRARRMDALAVALLMAVAAAFGVILMLLAAPTAKADSDSEAYAYAAHYAGAVCAVLDDYPTVNGMLGIMAAITEDGLSNYQAGQVVGISIAEVCPRYGYLVDLFVDRYGDKGSLA